MPGQNATRTFNGTAGQRISFNFTGVTMASVKVIVKAPPRTEPRRRPSSSDTFGTDGDFRRSGDAARGPTGTYTVTIDPQDASTGSVTLTFYNVPADTTGTTSCATTVPGQNCKLDADRQLRHAHAHGDDQRSCADRPDAERLAHRLPGNDDHAGESGRLRHGSDPRGNDFEVSFPSNGTYGIRDRPVRRRHRHDLGLDLLGLSGQPAS